METSPRITEKNGRYQVAFGITRRWFNDLNEAVLWVAEVAARSGAARQRRIEVGQLRREFTHHLANEAELVMVDLTARASLPAILPTDPGYVVYVARDIHGEPLYVGMTGFVYLRLAEHRQGSRWWPDAHSVAIHPAGTRRRAVDLEARLIARLQPPYNIVGVAV